MCNRKLGNLVMAVLKQKEKVNFTYILGKIPTHPFRFTVLYHLRLKISE